MQPSGRKLTSDAPVCPVCHAPWGDSPFCPNDGTLRSSGALIADRYELERLLGDGGMGFVFAGRHKMLGRPVAIKMLRGDGVADADQVGRFLREARLSSQIRHDNVVSITDFGRDTRGHPFLVMDLLVGESLADVLARHDAMPMRRALRILRQICRALDAVHSAGIVHRDLTPRNIFLVTESGRQDVVKLLDFSISRTMSGLDRITSTGVAVGTTPYMSTEQLRGSAEQDRQVDIYALGVIAHELLTGELPFRAQNAAELIAEKLTQESVDLHGTDLDARAPAIAQLVSECLAPEPHQRPASAAEVEQRLLSGSGGHVAQPEDLEGVRIGSYRLVRLLGAGGVGSVWQGEHPVIGSHVAIKILHPEMSEFEEAVRRFVVEAQAVNRIDSPYIVKTFDFGKLPDGRDYAVMEFLQGETLGQRLLLTGPLTWQQTRPIALALARALVSAHEAGIVHRDIKPDNIHVGTDLDDPMVKVLDFGVARLIDGDVASTHATRIGIVIGTPLYASPEQMLAEPVGPPADIYALGTVIFEVLTGKPPFTGTISELVAAKQSGVPPILGLQVPDIPPELSELVSTMLALRPEDRPSAAQVLAILQGKLLGSKKGEDYRAMVVDPSLDEEAVDLICAAETKLNASSLDATSAPSLSPSSTSDSISPPIEAPIEAPIPTPLPSLTPIPASERDALSPTITDDERVRIRPILDEAADLHKADLQALRSSVWLFWVGGIVVVVGILVGLFLWGRQPGEAAPSELAPTRAKTLLAARDAAGHSPEDAVGEQGATSDAKPRERSDKESTHKAAGGSASPTAGVVASQERVYWVRSIPSGAQVMLADRVVGLTPVRVRLMSQVRSVRIIVSLHGYRKSQATLDAAGPRTVQVRLRRMGRKALRKEAPPRGLPRGRRKTSPQVKSHTKGKLVDPFDD